MRGGRCAAWFWYLWPGYVWGASALALAISWILFRRHPGIPPDAWYHDEQTFLLIANWFFCMPGLILSPILAAAGVQRVQTGDAAADHASFRQRHPWWNGTRRGVLTHLEFLPFLFLGLLVGFAIEKPFWRAAYGVDLFILALFFGILQIVLAVGVLLPNYSLTFQCYQEKHSVGFVLGLLFLVAYYAALMIGWMDYRWPRASCLGSPLFLCVAVLNAPLLLFTKVTRGNAVEAAADRAWARIRSREFLAIAITYLLIVPVLFGAVFLLRVSDVGTSYFPTEVFGAYCLRRFIDTLDFGAVCARLLLSVPFAVFASWALVYKMLKITNTDAGYDVKACVAVFSVLLNFAFVTALIWDRVVRFALPGRLW